MSRGAVNKRRSIHARRDVTQPASDHVSQYGPLLKSAYAFMVHALESERPRVHDLSSNK
jgi:hypothetical protein